MPRVREDQDQLPLVGGHTLEEFCSRAKRSNRNALARIVQIELLKDTRIVGIDHYTDRGVQKHWRHEFLVFTIADDKEGYVLYFERGLDEDLSMFKFILSGFRGASEDTLEFHNIDSEEDREKRDWTRTVFKVKFRLTAQRPFCLLHLSQILDAGSYYDKYPQYGLFLANCWAWARGVLFDVIRHPHTETEEIFVARGEHTMASITREELELCILTEYGAWGRLLLHFSERDRLIKQSRWSYKLIRVIFYLYTILKFLVHVKERIIGPSNWVVGLRKLSIYHDITLDEKKQDLTFLPLPPNFTDLVPTLPGSLDSSLLQSLCFPGKYLLLSTSAISTVPVPVSSIHIYVFGDISNISESVSTVQNPNSWISCGLVRPSKGSDAIEIIATESLNISSLGTRRDAKQHYYSVIYLLDSDHPLTREIKPGDMIAVWAHVWCDRCTFINSCDSQVPSSDS